MDLLAQNAEFVDSDRADAQRASCLIQNLRRSIDHRLKGLCASDFDVLCACETKGLFFLRLGVDQTLSAPSSTRLSATNHKERVLVCLANHYTSLCWVCCIQCPRRNTRSICSSVYNQSLKTSAGLSNQSLKASAGSAASHALPLNN